MRLHYSDMKKGHCQDGKNTSAPFYLFPQHWDGGDGGDGGEGESSQREERLCV